MNDCPVGACNQVTGEGTINLGGGKTYKLVDLCIEPKTFAVEEEVGSSKRGETKKEFVPTKLVTRQTYTLAGISGDIKVRERWTMTTTLW